VGREQARFLHCLLGSQPVVLSHHRNASLGHGDTDDRIHPEQVVLGHYNVSEGSEKARETDALKLQSALARDVQMSRLHTGMKSSPHLPDNPVEGARFYSESFSQQW
jgi:hypothetical protein